MRAFSVLVLGGICELRAFICPRLAGRQGLCMHRSVRIAFLTFFLACASFAQRDLSTLAGTVTDPSGGVVANASIKITEVGTGQVYQLTTNTRGEFVRPALKPSTYVITVSAPGFNRAEQKDVLLDKVV